MWNKVQRECILLFSGFFGLLWCWLIIMVLVSFNESKKICILAAFFLLILFVAVAVFRKFTPSIWKNGNIWLAGACVLFIIITLGLLCAGLALRVYPSWDFGSVYLGAVELAEDGAFSGQSNWYFTTYPNNVAVCMFLAGIFKLFGGFCNYITLGVLLNIFLLVLGLIFLFLLVCHLYGRRFGFLAILFCAVFAPFYMHAPIFYTDTFALPFVTGAFLSYQLRKKDVRFMVLTAAVLALGYKIKGSLGVIVVALLIHIWLQKEKLKVHVIQSLLLVVPFLLTTTFLTALPRQLSFLDTTEASKNEFPIEHWLAMGLVGNGGYSSDVYWITASTEGKEAKKEVDRGFIREKLGEYGARGMRQHLQTKILFTWGDGVYFAPEKLKREPLQESPLHTWVLYDGANYGKTYQYCSAVHWLLLFGVLLSVLCNFLERGEGREAQAMQIALFGLFLFLLIWETRSRYLVNFVPVFILLSIDGIWGIIRYTDGRRKDV